MKNLRLSFTAYFDWYVKSLNQNPATITEADVRLIFEAWLNKHGAADGATADDFHHLAALRLPAEATPVIAFPGAPPEPGNPAKTTPPDSGPGPSGSPIPPFPELARRCKESLERLYLFRGHVDRMTTAMQNTLTIVEEVSAHQAELSRRLTRSEEENTRLRRVLQQIGLMTVDEGSAGLGRTAGDSPPYPVPHELPTSVVLERIAPPPRPPQRSDGKVQPAGKDVLRDEDSSPHPIPPTSIRRFRHEIPS